MDVCLGKLWSAFQGPNYTKIQALAGIKGQGYLPQQENTSIQFNLNTPNEVLFTELSHKQALWFWVKFCLS